MTRYSLIGPDPQTMGQITESESPPQKPRHPFYWLPIIDDTQPFDPWQQMRVCTYTVASDHVQETCQIREMTDDELAFSRDANATRFDDVWSQITFDHENRIREMEKGKPIPLTMQQWQDNIKTILRGQ